MSTLILGAGHRQIRWLPRVDGFLQQSEDWPEDTITLDNNPDVKPDVLWDLNNCLPFAWMVDRFGTGVNIFDEIHAYEVLEHCGTQGDYEFFFNQFADIWEYLKPDGHFYGSVPQYDSMWALGDPSHRRVIPDGSFVFLSQVEYARQCDGPEKTPMSDFRHIYKADFETEGLYRHGDSLFFDLRRGEAFEDRDMTDISMARACALLIEGLRHQNVNSDALSHRVRDGLRLLNEASDGYAFAILDQQEHTRRTRERDELKRLRRIVREDYERVDATSLNHGEDPNDRD